MDRTDGLCERCPGMIGMVESSTRKTARVTFGGMMRLHFARDGIDPRLKDPAVCEARSDLRLVLGVRPFASCFSRTL